MNTRKVLMNLSLVGFLSLALLYPYAQNQDDEESGVRGYSEDAGLSVSRLFIQTLPYSLLNTIPGFGVGSFSQGQTRTGKFLALADTLAWGLLVPGTVLSLRSLGEGATGGDEVSGVDLVLLGGFGVYAGSRIVGLAAPIFSAFKHGQDPQRLMAPVFYNMLPGFGLGSQLQGDMKSARLLRIMDLAALGALGALSGFALGGEDIPAAASAIVLIGLFGTSKVGGVILPHRYRDAYTSE